MAKAAARKCVAPRIAHPESAVASNPGPVPPRNELAMTAVSRMSKGKSSSHRVSSSVTSTAKPVAAIAKRYDAPSIRGECMASHRLTATETRGLGPDAMECPIDRPHDAGDLQRLL